jgi:hypothetical protein
MAYEPGPVEIRGTGLGLVTGLRLNGHALDILSNSGRRIVFEPPNQAPGFGLLELVRPHDSLTEPIEFMPSLQARWSGDQFQVRLNPGYPGWVVLSYSLRRNLLMHNVPDAYYGEWLDFSTPHSGVLTALVLSDGNPLELPWMRMPRGLMEHGGLGTTRPIYLQAFCMLEHELCFTNMVSVQPAL